MFIKIGAGIFNSDDIEAIVFEEGEITVTLKGEKDESDRQYNIDKDCDCTSVLEGIVKELNTEMRPGSVSVV